MKLIDIAFDLDGVLVDIIEPLRFWLQKLYKAKIVNLDQYQFITDPILESYQLWKCINLCYKFYKKVPIYPGAIQLLKKLYFLSDGDPIRIITARPAKTSANFTYRFISEKLCSFPYELILTSERSKLPYLKRYTYFIEDNREIAIELADSDKKVFLIGRSYNRLRCNHENIIEIESIEELLLIAETFIKEINGGI